MKNATPLIKEVCDIQGLKYPEEVDQINPRALIRHTIQRCIDVTNGSIELEPGQKVDGEGALLLRMYFGV